MSRVAKVTISVPTEMLEAIERQRESNGATRSEFFVRAVEEFLRRERERQADEAYIRGYQEFPESEDDELQTWVQGGLEALAHLYRDEEPWSQEQLEADKRQEPAR